MTKTLRPSPTESATLFAVGTKKKGNDGRTYEVVQTRNGVQRWAGHPTSTKQVFTVHNYDVKFMVRLTSTSRPGTAQIFKKVGGDKSPRDPANFALWRSVPYQQAFIGFDPVESKPGVKTQTWFGGNSVLLKLDPDHWLFIGADVRALTFSDQITRFVSPMGNNQVPYPYAVGQMLTYLLIEDVAVPNVDAKTDPYRVYYNLDQKSDAKKHRVVSKVLVKSPF